MYIYQTKIKSFFKIRDVMSHTLIWEHNFKLNELVIKQNLRFASIFALLKLIFPFGRFLVSQTQRKQLRSYEGF